MKHCCENCYFLWFSQKLPVDSTYGPIPAQRRSSYHWVDDKTTIYCHKGIWILEKANQKPEKLKSNLSENRKDSCFFVEHRDEMDVNAADELQRRLHENRQFKRSLTFTQIGLWIAALGTIASLVYQYLSEKKILP